MSNDNFPSLKMRRQSSVKLIYPNAGFVKLRLASDSSSNNINNNTLNEMIRNMNNISFNYKFETELLLLERVKNHRKKLDDLKLRIQSRQRQEQEAIFKQMEYEKEIRAQEELAQKLARESAERERIEQERKRQEELLAKSERISQERREALRNFQGISGQNDDNKCADLLLCFDYDVEKAVQCYFDNGGQLDIALAVARADSEEPGNNIKKEPPAQDVEQMCYLTIEMPNGSQQVASLKFSDTLWSVYEIVARNADQWGNKPFALIKKSPRIHYTEDMLNSTLRAASIHYGDTIIAQTQ